MFFNDSQREKYFLVYEILLKTHKKLFFVKNQGTLQL